MQKEQSFSKKIALNTDYLAWRIVKAKKRRSEVTRNSTYNQRPRLRSDAHH